ncbi:MAG: helix-turn-helix transcriptional regulator [Ruminococcaceae bacterium]|nr:helix-turn-helix transcriptional regulator [Oscillospiraceae bacterium]
MTGQLEVMSQDDFCTVYRLTDAAEESRITVYSVFPGIRLIYRDIHSPDFVIRQEKSDLILEISHCREGRLEYETDAGCCYLMPGDFAVLHRHDTAYRTCFPISHYHGISVIIDLAETPRCLSCFLADVTVSPHELADKFCAGHPFFVARSTPRIDHVFSELYHVPEELRRGYFKVKMLELMLFLTALDPTSDESRHRSCTHSQVMLAKNVCRYLTDRISERITLEELSEVFHMSGTSIKNSFRMVYGESVYAHIRAVKMKMAAELLRDGGLTVMEIAGRFGYDNASKFAGAFRDVMGMTPGEFRASQHP